MAKCKSCARKRRKNTVGALSADKIPTEALLAGVVGALAAKVVDGPLSQIPVAAFQQPIVRDGIKLGLGIVMTMMDNEMIANAGLGMATYTGARIVGSFLPTNLNDNGSVSGVGGLTGIFGSGRYQVGSGPVNIAGARGGQIPYAGSASFESMSGTGGYDDGLVTAPDKIYGMDDEMDEVQAIN